MASLLLIYSNTYGYEKQTNAEMDAGRPTAYFDNDASGHAVKNAMTLASML
jgi:hypothetical protein